MEAVVSSLTQHHNAGMPAPGGSSYTVALASSPCTSCGELLLLALSMTIDSPCFHRCLFKVWNPRLAIAAGQEYHITTGLPLDTLNSWEERGREGGREGGRERERERETASE
jgi:hypothetical protein